jgi:preprotein translocase subunit SecG
MISKTSFLVLVLAIALTVCVVPTFQASTTPGATNAPSSEASNIIGAKSILNAFTIIQLISFAIFYNF